MSTTSAGFNKGSAGPLLYIKLAVFLCSEKKKKMTREHRGGKLRPRAQFLDKQNELSQSRGVRLPCVCLLPHTQHHFFFVERRIVVIIFVLFSGIFGEISVEVLWCKYRVKSVTKSFQTYLVGVF